MGPGRSGSPAYRLVPGVGYVPAQEKERELLLVVIRAVVSGQWSVVREKLTTDD
ncbi:hypothetical protein SBDP1_1090028 [Syntrophobacter sp. SbD1]|nr:hypothetical protein SBDP1_1090028 [Syntrophobacter sp. SbD1]